MSRVIISRAKVEELTNVLVEHPTASDFMLNQEEFMFIADDEQIEQQIFSSPAPPPPAAIACKDYEEFVGEVLDGKNPRYYEGKAVRAIQLDKSYIVDGNTIPADEYLLEANTADGSKPQWIVMNKKFFEEQFKPIQRRTSNRILLSIYENLQILMGSQESATDLYVRLNNLAQCGDRIVWYNPEQEDYFICRPKGIWQTVRRKDLQALIS